MVNSFTRIAAAGAAVAAVFAGTVTTAQAADVGVLDTNKTISNSHGRMTYIDDGDMFEVCDTKADGYGMTGQVVVATTGNPVLTVTDGGDAGCDKGGYNVGQLFSVYMAVVWNGGGDWVYSEHFTE
ncbi:hypothetical protein ACFU98_05160 [Streptomyces sp. NPDC057575]|uniref:hypothetical protein n=1 Tax=unclassified Streptomyces TaxID=2593676 RepID=UPI0036AFF54A